MPEITAPLAPFVVNPRIDAATLEKIAAWLADLGHTVHGYGTVRIGKLDYAAVDYQVGGTGNGSRFLYIVGDPTTADHKKHLYRDSEGNAYGLSTWTPNDADATTERAGNHLVPRWWQIFRYSDVSHVPTSGDRGGKLITRKIAYATDDWYTGYMTARANRDALRTDRPENGPFPLGDPYSPDSYIRKHGGIWGTLRGARSLYDVAEYALCEPDLTGQWARVLDVVKSGPWEYSTTFGRFRRNLYCETGDGRKLCFGSQDQTRALSGQLGQNGRAVYEGFHVEFWPAGVPMQHI